MTPLDPDKKPAVLVTSVSTSLIVVAPALGNGYAANKVPLLR